MSRSEHGRLLARDDSDSEKEDESQDDYVADMPLPSTSTSTSNSHLGNLDEVSRDLATGTGNPAASLPRISTQHVTPGRRRDPASSSSSPGGNVSPAAAAAAVPAPALLPPPGWKDLPRKDQLLLITFARLSEPLVQTSLQSYMYYQLKWFDESLPDATIAAQAGALHAGFTAAQCLTAMLWGRVADSPRFGRKFVILVGLAGTCLSCLAYGFATSFPAALAARVLGGVTNGNIGVLRTMVGETIREKRFQSRAFLLLPMTFNIGVIVGPILGGLLSDPAATYPGVFGGWAFFEKFPYAAPNLLNAIFLFMAMLSVWLALEETLDAIRARGSDLGIRIGQKLMTWLRALLSRIRLPGSKPGYKRLQSHSRQGSERISTDTILEMDDEPESPTQQRRHQPSVVTEQSKKQPAPRYRQRLPFRRIFTSNVIFTLVTHFLLAFHIGTFNSLWFVFLSTPAYDPSDPKQPQQKLPFHFTGGLGLSAQSVGWAMAILGGIGITLQLLVYPPVSARLGMLRSLRCFLLCFPVAYTLAPYLAVVPSSSPVSAPAASLARSVAVDAVAPNPKTGALIWICLALVLSVQVTGRTFVLPSTAILVNNCSPHPSVLGTVHGLAQSVSSAARTVGPALGGWLFGLGLEGGMVGGVWWGMAGVAVLAAIASWAVKEGDGHEIWLEGDEMDEDEVIPYRDEEADLEGDDGRAGDREGNGRPTPAAAATTA